MEFVDNQETGFLNKCREFNRAHPLVKYSLRRILSALITIFIAVSITFMLLRTLDPAVYYGNYINKVPVEMKEAIKQQILHNIGLDKPLLIQLFNYYYKIIPFIPKTVCLNQSIIDNALVCTEEVTRLVDFGISYVYTPNATINSIIFDRMPWSIKIGMLSLIIQFLIGYPLGILMAKYKDKVFDTIGNLYIVIISAIPTIVYYFLIYYLFLLYTPITPIFDVDHFETWIPCIIALGIMGSTGTAMWVRRFMVDELNSDYVKFARAKGLPENKIVFKHVLRNAIVPIIRTIPMAIAFTLLGAYFAETVFSVPGIGKLLIEAIQKQDNELVQALVLIFALISTTAYLIGDIVTALFDPRISLTSND